MNLAAAQRLPKRNGFFPIVELVIQDMRARDGLAS